MGYLISRLRNFAAMSLVFTGAIGGGAVAYDAVIERGGNETTARAAALVGVAGGAMGFYAVAGIVRLADKEKSRP
jgi:hypothetical protein